MLLTETTGNPFDTNPPKQRHGRMVVDMKKADLCILFTKHKEHLKKWTQQS